MLNLTIEHDQLSAPLGRVAAVADPRSAIAAYSAIKLSADEFGLTLTAANSVQLLAERIELPDCGGGHVYVVAARLRDLVASLDPSKPIKFYDDESGVRLQSGRTRARLGRIDPIGFPVEPSRRPEPQIEVTTKELARALGLILPAIGTDKDRAIYSSVCIRDDDGVSLAALDGRQGAVAYLGGATGRKFPDALLPRATATRLLALTRATSDHSIYIAIGQGLASFHAAGWMLSSRLVAIEFPGVAWIAPPVAQPVVLTAADLERILARIDAAIDLDNIKLKQRGAQLRAMNGTLTVSGDHNVLVDDMPATMGIEPVTVGVSTRQLRHCLHAIGTERVELHIGSAIRVCAAGETRESYTLAPYRL